MKDIQFWPKNDQLSALHGDRRTCWVCVDAREIFGRGIKEWEATAVWSQILNHHQLYYY